MSPRRRPRRPAAEEDRGREGRSNSMKSPSARQGWRASRIRGVGESSRSVKMRGSASAPRSRLRRHRLPRLGASSPRCGPCRERWRRRWPPFCGPAAAAHGRRAHRRRCARARAGGPRRRRATRPRRPPLAAAAPAGGCTGATAGRRCCRPMSHVAVSRRRRASTPGSPRCGAATPTGSATSRQLDPLRRHDVLLAAAARRRRDERSGGPCWASTTSRRSASSARVRRRFATLLELAWRASDGVAGRRPSQADAFCHNMVRALVGALLAVGEERSARDLAGTSWPPACAIPASR